MSDIIMSFFNGEYSTLVSQQVDTGSLHRFSELERAYLIGALVFVGRRQDAKAEFAAHMTKASLDTTSIARFFLGLGACRDSEYAESRKLFCENYRTFKSLETAEARFFALQGLGFYRFFCSRFKKSILWSERSWQEAFASRFQYGMILSADLRGHGLLQVGRVAQGLKSFENAMQWAERAQNGGVKNALEISVVCYRSQVGLLNKASNELHKKWKTVSISDTYSRSNLLLELVRALILEGKVTSALEWLENESQEIFRSGHRRQKATFLARRASALILQGRDDEALNAIDSGLSLLEDESDLAHRLDLLGLKLKIKKDEYTQHQVEELTRQTGRGIAYQIQARALEKSAPLSDDFLGQLINQLTKEPKNVELLTQVEQKGWHGLLNRLIEREPGVVLYLDLLPNQLVIFQGGDVHISPSSVPNILKRLLIILTKGPTDKQNLIETVWGYKYDSLRHDPLLYNSIYRLRQLLGKFEKLLIAQEGGYAWTQTVTARVFERSLPQQVLATHEEITEDGLSLRQHRALQLIKRETAISVSDYAKFLKVAKATATRDLAELVNKGYLSKKGRARATNYLLKGTL